MRLPATVRLSFLLLALFVGSSVGVGAQTPDSTASQSTPGSISGKVTMSGKAAAGVKIVLVEDPPNTTFSSPGSGDVIARTQTDDSGAYTFTDLASGNYRVVPASPTDVLSAVSLGMDEGKRVLLDNGQQASGVDLPLTRGGVITGRVVDSTNQPVIGEHLTFEKVDDKGNPSRFFSVRSWNVETDDRGIYRAYGLPEGRFKVSVGGTTSSSDARHFPQTYAPGVTDAAAANIVEVKPGSEASNVDISLGVAARTYSASGRFVDADTGQPVAGVSFMYSYIRQGVGTGSVGYGSTTDTEGKFALQGLAPGHYKMSLGFNDTSGYTLTSGEFDVLDSNVDGVVVTLSRGSSVSGIVAVDNNSDPAVSARLANVSLVAYVFPDSGGVTTARPVNPLPDGSFQVSGLGAGSLSFQVRSNDSAGFRVAHVQLNGVDQPRGIQISPGQNLTGITVVLSYGTGSIHGTIKMAAGEIPQGARLYVFVRRTGGQNGVEGMGAMADAVGHFQVGSVPDGDYQVSCRGFVLGGPPLRLQCTGPTVSVVAGQTVDVVLNAQVQPLPAKQ